MYPLISILAIIIGAILLMKSKKIINNKRLRFGTRIIGVCMAVAGLVTFYLLLSGKLVLPLLKS